MQRQSGRSASPDRAIGFGSLELRLHLRRYARSTLDVGGRSGRRRRGRASRGTVRGALDRQGKRRRRRGARTVRRRAPRPRGAALMLFRVFTVLAVVALCVSTWILSSPARRPQTQIDAKQADLPGYYLKNAVLTDYDLAGDPNVRIEAERIDQIAHGNEVALYNVRVAYQAPNGQSWVMVGD